MKASQGDATHSLRFFKNPTSMMGFHLLRLLRLHGSRGSMYEYIASIRSHRRTKSHEETRGIFPWEARSKSNCPMVRRSRVFISAVNHRLQEEVIIRYESSRTSSVGDEKWKTKGELLAERKELKKKQKWKRREGAWKGIKKREKPSRHPVGHPKADLFFLPWNFPNSHHIVKWNSRWD